jgi:uncharacterized RDD family membrane protein YckC
MLEAGKIAGFWRRLFALFIDGILLAIVGMVIGAAFYPQLVEMGQSGRLIGAAITLVYYGVLNSGWGGGATLGKRMLGLRVVRRDGHTIGLFRSFVRTVIFWTPFYLNGVFFQSVHIPGLPPDPRILMVVGVLDVAAVFVGTFLIFYLYLFNARTRQSLHDLIAGTFVVRAEPADAPVAVHVWKGHLIVALLLVLLLSGGTFWIYKSRVSFTGAGTTLEQLTALQHAVGARPGVGAVQAQTSTFVTTSGKQTALILVVRMRVIPPSLDAVENDVATTVLKTDPTILGQQNLSVKVVYGYELGIWSWTVAEQFSGSLADWSKRLRDAKPTTSV